MDATYTKGGEMKPLHEPYASAPTPVTDSVKLSGSVAHSWSLMREHARQLERRLAYAEAKLAEANKERDEACGNVTKALKELSDLVKQRDEARQEVAALSGKIERLVCATGSNNLGDLCDRIEHWQKQAKALHDFRMSFNYKESYSGLEIIRAIEAATKTPQQTLQDSI